MSGKPEAGSRQPGAGSGKREARGTAVAIFIIAVCASVSAFQWPGTVRKTPEKAPVLTPEQERATIVVPPGFRVELVASEPLVMDPIVIDFDADGRMWVVEMPGFMPDTSGRDSREPINSVVVLEDTNGDRRMDKRTVFADELVLPRALKVLDDGRALVGEPPNLWLMTDTDGDLKADAKVLVSNTYGRLEANPEHNANTLLWAMDNTIYTSEHDWHLRWKNGKFETIPTLSRGQWGASQDDAGRIYRNFNDAPLFVDYLSPSYYMRNPNLARTRGLYDPLISREASVVWPVRANRGVNRGYRDQFFRADDSSVTIQAAGTPVIFRGDRLPKTLQGQAFISDSGTNLVHGYRIRDDGLGRLRAEDLYKNGEIFASWDERCRPVNLASAPDGTLYVVDMYRGVVQDGVYWTEFLRDYIKSRDLELPVKRGRIWRIVHDNMRPSAAPRLSSATPLQLLEILSHPNGWWRDTAQQLLVQRGDKTIVPPLRDLAGRAPDWRTRLHALWTLDGLDALEPAQVAQALSDKSADVRASAVRLAERWLGDVVQPIAADALGRMDDASWTVRRQVAASIGALPLAMRLDRATAMLEKYGDDSVVVDATISGLRGSETHVFERLLRATSEPGSRERSPASGRGRGRGLLPSGARHADAVTMLAAAITRSGEPVAVQELIARATDSSDAPWQRLAMLHGLDAGLTGSGGRGRGSRTVTLATEPTALLRLASIDTQMGRLGASVADRLTWPGKPAPLLTVPPLTSAERRRFDAGAELYKNLCIACHQADGRGREKLAPALVGSRYVVAQDPGNAARIVLGGMEGPIGLMPPLASALGDEQIAAVLTYIRREWGHTASAVAPDDVKEIRGLTKTRPRPWTAAELPQGRGGR